jgi:hypothetical protein
MVTMTLEERITRLEDIEAIKQLKFRYSHICVFASDGIWESEAFGVAKGHAEIEELFRGFEKMFSFSQHNMMNPIIEVDGNSATGIWYIMGPWTQTEGNNETWMALRYDDEYIKIDGEWKYKHLKVELRMTADR